MKEKPIIFSAPMVRAILKGNKQQTRRIIRKEITEKIGNLLRLLRPCRRGKYEFMSDGQNEVNLKPFAFPNDHLWVKETWADVNTEEGPAICYRADGSYRSWHDFSKTFGPDYGAGPSMDYEAYPGDYSMWWSDLLASAPDHGWNPSIHMPKWASRLKLSVVRIRIEQLHDISTTDAIAEGVPETYADALTMFGQKALKNRDNHLWDNHTPIENFQWLWDSINSEKYSWKSNPWVWVIEFQKNDWLLKEALAEV